MGTIQTDLQPVSILSIGMTCQYQYDLSVLRYMTCPMTCLLLYIEDVHPRDNAHDNNVLSVPARSLQQ